MACKGKDVALAPPNYKNIFPIERLPAELREMIYIELLGRNTLRVRYRDTLENRTTTKRGTYVPGGSAKVSIHDSTEPRKKIPFLGAAGAAILRANKLLYHEALPILYGKNTFHFISRHAITAFLQPKAGLKFVQHIEIALQSDQGYSGMMKQLIAFEGLHSVEIGLWFHEPDKLALHIARWLKQKPSKQEKLAELEKISFAVGMPRGYYNPDTDLDRFFGVKAEVMKRLKIE